MHCSVAHIACIVIEQYIYISGNVPYSSGVKGLAYRAHRAHGRGELVKHLMVELNRASTG